MSLIASPSLLLQADTGSGIALFCAAVATWICDQAHSSSIHILFFSQQLCNTKHAYIMVGNVFISKSLFEKSVGTTELHYSTKKWYHVLTILWLKHGTAFCAVVKSLCRPKTVHLAVM